MRRHLLALAAAALVPLATPAVAQQSSAGGPPVTMRAPQSLLDAFGVRDGTVQELALPASGRQPFGFTIVLGGSPVTVSLQAHEIRAADFQLLVDDGAAGGPRPVATPSPIAWRGTAAGFADSVIAAAMRDGRITAWIDLGDGAPAWCVEPSRRFDPTRPAAEHLIYAETDSNRDGVSCGADTSVHQDSPPMQSTAARKVCEIAIDCDLEFYQRNNSSVQDVQDTVVAHINATSAIYERDIDVQYDITAILVRTRRTYSNTDMRQLLPEFRSEWNRRQGSIRRDVAQLFTGKGGFGGIVGIAYVGVICNTSSAYGVDKAFSGFGTNVGLIAHELGHNWNAPHCDSSSTCNIMCAGLGGCNNQLGRFAPVSINTITNYKNSRSCLSDPVAPSLTSVAPNRIPVYPFSQLTLRGSGFTGATAVNIGGNTTSDFTFVNDSTITMESIAPQALGQQPVTVEIAGAASNPVGIDFTPAGAPTHSAPAFWISGLDLDIDMIGDPSDSWLLVVGFNDLSTFRFRSFDVLANRIGLASGTLNLAGYGRYTIPVPAIPLAGVAMGTQVVTIDDQTGDIAFITTLKATGFLY